MERRISLLQDSRKAILFFVCAEGKRAASRAAIAEGKRAAAEAAVYIEEFDYWKSSLMNMMQPEKEGSAGSQR
ncbi:hypothetical protein OCV77_08160 [Suilimivivens aceti]|uniref:Uncharacterized protein n=1 Tax=Suilimivivens aceti TaxID=2981774 RepID=A0ABT2T2H2_9FIRM|nr:hypothetical protein [Suilimivivens aceti]MCU6744467.1 hypothetical protein [Suilimivivens aceti]